MSLQNFRSSLDSIWQRYWGLAALAVWAAIYLFLPMISFQTSGIDEGSARGLLLNWAVADRVINPIVILGMPDFRALLFAPLAIYWPGSMVAAKVFVLLVYAAGVAGVYRWARQRFNDETAMLSAGLLLIAPLALTQIEALGAGPFLLAGMTILWRVETAYAQSTRAVGGLYYFRLLLIAIVTTLHPAGLGYPLALIWHWSRNPTGNAKQRTQVIGGIVITLFVVGVLRAGWVDLPWFKNPVATLSTLLSQPGLDESAEWPLGVLPLVIFAGLVVAFRRQWLRDTAGLGWLLGIVIGALAADDAWGLVTLAMLLTYGIAGLLQLQQRFSFANFAGQRGVLLLFVFVLSVLFMRDDKVLVDLHRANVIGARDRLLHLLSAEVENQLTRVTTASQWPGQTMLTCRCEVLPLPPIGANSAEFEKSIKGLRYVVFNPGDDKQHALAQRIAELNGLLKTVAMEEGAVLLEVLPETPPK